MPLTCYPRGIFSGLAAIFLCGNTLPAREDPVHLTQINFQRARIDGVRGDWLEIEIELEGGERMEKAAGNPGFVDRVTVALSLGFSIRRGGGRAIRYFKAEAAVATLERDDDRSVFFYIPPEVVRRDGLSRQPYAYLVELTVGDRLLPTRREHVSSSLGDAARVANFKTMIRREGDENEGVLRPIYKTPFYALRAKLSASPSYIR